MLIDEEVSIEAKIQKDRIYKDTGRDVEPEDRVENKHDTVLNAEDDQLTHVEDDGWIQIQGSGSGKAK